MGKLKNIHPGEVLEEEFLKPLNITAYALAKGTGISQTRVSQIIKGKRRITANTAIRFAKFFETSPHFWLGLQNDYDIEEEQTSKNQVFNRITAVRVKKTVTNT